MAAKRCLSNCEESRFMGTGNLLQDLLCSTVAIKRLKSSTLSSHNHNYKSLQCSTVSNSDNKVQDLCSICYGDKEKVYTTTQREMNILEEFVLKSWSTESCVTPGLEFHSICILCSKTLKRLDKCRKEIEGTVLCLRTIIRMQIVNGQKSNMVNRGGISHADLDVKCPVEKSVQLVELDDTKIASPGVMEFEMTDIESDDEEDNIAQSDNKAAESSTLVITIDEGSAYSAISDLDDEINESHVLADVTGTKSILDEDDGTICSRDLDDADISTVDKGRKILDKVERLIQHKNKKGKGVHQRKRCSINSQKRNLVEAEYTNSNCDVCLLEFASEYHLRRHCLTNKHDKGVKCRRVNQSGGVTFVCDKCQLEFNVLETLLDHHRTEHKTKEYECKHCNQSFLTVRMLRNHKNGCVSAVGFIDIDNDDLKPVVLNIEFDISGDTNKLDNVQSNEGGCYLHGSGGFEERVLLENPCGIDDTDSTEIRTKRQSRVRAEELLQSLSKIESATDTGDEGDLDSNYEEGELTDDDSGDDNLVEVGGVIENNSRLQHPVSRRRRDEDEGDGVDVKARNRLKLGRIRQQTKPDDNKLIYCEPCNKTFAEKFYKGHVLCIRHAKKIGGDAVEELKKKRKFKCEKCERMFVTSVQLRSHIYSSHKRPCVCEKCGKSFPYMQGLNYHLTTHRENPNKTHHAKPTRCQPCDQTFKTFAGYQYHVISARHANMIGKEAVKELEKNRKFNCESCNKKFLTKQQLIVHQIVHGPPRFVCETCGKQFLRLRALERHQSTHEDRPKTDRKKIMWFLAPQDKPVACTKCEKRFTNKLCMFRHLKVIHNGHRYKCNTCPRDFAGSGALLQHKRRAHEHIKPKPKSKKRHQCDMCSTSLAVKETLMRHIELVHFPAKDTCPYGCPDKFETKQEWISHLEQCKSEKMTEKSKCYYCGEVFSNHILRISHHLDLHTTHSCEICTTSFTRQSVLDYHLHSHEQSKPHLCSKCGKSFKQQYNLQIHSTTVCGDDEDAKKQLIIKRREKHRIFREKEKPHKCDICSKGFVEERRLAAHKLKKHARQGKSSDEDEVGDDDTC